MNGVVAKSVEDRVKARPVARPVADSGGDFHQLAVFDLKGLPVVGGPPAHADHLVIFHPVGERVVRAVIDIHAAAAANVGFEFSFDFFGPGNLKVFDVVAGLNDDVVSGEVRGPPLPVPGIKLGHGRNRDLEGGVAGEDVPDLLGGFFNGVIAEAVDDQDADIIRMGGCGPAG